MATFSKNFCAMLQFPEIIVTFACNFEIGRCGGWHEQVHWVEPLQRLMAAMSVAAAMTVRQRRAAAQQARMPWEVRMLNLKKD